MRNEPKAKGYHLLALLSLKCQQTSKQNKNNKQADNQNKQTDKQTKLQYSRLYKNAK
jgi:hypothetical protein